MANALESSSVNPRKLHPTGLVPESLAAQVLDFMAEQRLGLRGLAAAAEVVAADCRYNHWVASHVKKSNLSEEGWMKLLEAGEETHARAKRAMQAYRSNGGMAEFCAAFADLVSRLNDRSLLTS